MGGIWKFTMPLFSTLAALVIIVHSAEEIYEQDKQIRPRSLDVAPPNYEQSWRAVEIEPETTPHSQINQEEAWSDDSSLQPMRRRRRKRKRRPDQPQDDLSPQSFFYQEATQTHQQDTAEMPRRRRKKIDHQDSRDRNRPVNWNEESFEQPLRRKGHRRKRPPVLSEFNTYRQYHRPDSSEEVVHNKDIRIDNNNEDRNDDKEVNEEIESEIEFSDQSSTQFVEATTQTFNIKNNLGHKSPLQKDDRFLSEFSSEVIQSTKNAKTSQVPSNQQKEKSNVNFNDVKISEERGPIDPLTLKDILKKSNGKSLSEILQQHNLSLSDLLHGKEKAISVLQRKDFIQEEEPNEVQRPKNVMFDTNIKSEEKITLVDHVRVRNKLEKKVEEEIETTTDCSSNIESATSKDQGNSQNSESIYTEESKNLPLEENTTRNSLRRRFPAGIRRRLRMRPSVNNTYKGQLSRDLITLTSLKYKNSKALSKSKEWKEVLPAMTKRGPTVIESNAKIASDIAMKMTTTTPTPEETTTEQIFETTTDPSEILMNTETSFYIDNGRIENLNSADTNGLNYETEKPLSMSTIADEDSKIVVVSEKPKIISIIRPLINSSELRRQTYNNRLKRKRLKQKTSTTALPVEQDAYSKGNLVSASEFVAKTQSRTTKSEQDDDFSTLEDFMTTEASRSTRTETTKSKVSQITNRFASSVTTLAPFTTGETAKYEIDEILSDNLASARLSKILKERNMTLRELVEHRERGSSHVHLADIFHNTSREPNPPEPFLSKSLIEPISKETYPLRALLEANSYDPKTTTIESNLNITNNFNIPVVMDFGNNVNENGENMGIISLFNNFSRIDSELQSQSDVSKKIVEEKLDNDNNLNNEVVRESRLLQPEKDFMTWNALISLMQKNHQVENVEEKKESTEDLTISQTLQKDGLENDISHESFIMIEDLQKIKDLDNRITSDELLELKLDERIESTKAPSVTSSFSNNTKSVTVVTASIIGLVLILFLLTYAILKWKQQTKMFQNKHAKEDECLPTPIFENRKGHKINSSTRSKSPMISSSNIYSVDTIDTHVGNESPEYMWDSLRKPFQ